MQPKWFNAGAKDYGFPPLALLSLEFLLLGFLELKRYQGFKKTGKVACQPHLGFAAPSCRPLGMPP